MGNPPLLEPSPASPTEQTLDSDLMVKLDELFMKYLEAICSNMRMSVFTPVNPMPFLQSLVGKATVVRLKWGQEYKGMLVSTDQYMNIQLANAEEFQDGNSNGVLPGELLIRCNNVLYVREIKQDDIEVSEPAEQALGRDSEDEQMEEGEQ
ncbi:hypothetical protein GGH17_001357 [Coemansia sp. RSA 788]|nr:hypothetical protein GGH17_001357 [Coemansia sp. RSA 788]